MPSFWDLDKSPLLQAVNVTIWTQSYCEAAWSNDPKPVIISKLMLCAADYLKDTCFWDGGGPLACFQNGANGSNELDTPNRWFLYGVGTGGSCATPNFPGIYARMTEFLDWIAKTVAED